MFVVCLLMFVTCQTSWSQSAGNGASVSGPEKAELRLLVLLPAKHGDYYYPFGYEMAGAAVLSAFDVIEKTRLLPGYRLQVDYADSGCHAIVGLGSAYDMLTQNNYSAVIGPQCSHVCRLVARLATHLNLPCFSGVCQDVEMLDKTEFPTLTRFLGTFEMTGFAISHFLKSQGWNRVGLIAEAHTDILWLLTKNGLHYSFKVDNITIAMSTLMSRQMNMTRVLKQTAQVSRVIILAMMGDVFRKLMVLAYEAGLHQGDYIFVCIDFYKQRQVLGSFSWNQGDGEDEIVRQVYPAVFFVSYYLRETTAEYQDFMTKVKNTSAEQFHYYYQPHEEVPYPAANLYEATLLYAVAVNETLRDKGDIRDGTLVSQRLWGRSFNSLTGSLTLNGNGDREQAYMIRHMQDLTSANEQVVAYYFGGNDSLHFLVDQITWPGGLTSPPKDTPPCGYEGEFCVEDENARMIKLVGIFIGVLMGTLVTATTAVILIYKKLKYERDIADMKWKIVFDDISQLKSGKYTSTLSQFSLISGKTSDSGSTAQGLVQSFIQTALYKGTVVAMKSFPHMRKVDLANKSFLLHMKQLYDLSHPNLARFVGACVEAQVIVLTEYCVKGSLQDLLENHDIQLDWTFKCSLMNDVIQGLLYLHDSSLGCHGNLKSSNCIVDGRFVVKLTDFGFGEWKHKPDIRPQDLLWTAPELLQGPSTALPGTQKGDVYSLAIIQQEIIYREGPCYVSEYSLEAAEVIRKVMAQGDPPYRPVLEESQCPSAVVQMVNRCWADNPQERPSLTEIKTSVQKAGGMSGNFSILDNLLSRMEQYANNLEGLVEERTGKYLEEKKRAEDLLHRLLPPSIANELQAKGQVAPVSYKQVTIYFSDIVQFTALCSESTPMQVVDMLNDLYTLFDSTIDNFDVYKVETIGDAYMAVSGLPVLNGDRHASEIAKMSLSLLTAVSTFRIRHRPGHQLQLRIGIHSGPCVAGVVGLTMPRYCLFGDTVNTASRMESNGEARKVHISTETQLLLEKQGGFRMAHRGDVEMKGKGMVKTYWLLSGPK